MQKFYSEDEIKRARRLANFREWEQKAKSNVQTFWHNNKTEIITLAPLVIGAGATLIKVTGKAINNHKAQDLKELYCYDRSLGHYWKLRRELTNSEWVEIDKRKASGERLADILDDLRVLK